MYPRTITLPPPAQRKRDIICDRYYAWTEGSALRLGIRVLYEEFPVVPAEFQPPCKLDDQLICFDWYNYAAPSFGHLPLECKSFKLQYTDVCQCEAENYHTIVSLCPPSFPNWQVYDDLVQQPREWPEYLRPICHRDNGIDHMPRRRKVQQLLKAAFGARVETAVRPFRERWFLRHAINSAVVVHIPGMWPHMMEWTHCQFFALGLCCITQRLWTHCMGRIAQPWEHYVPVSDDLEDVVDRVLWCDAHPAECREIGQRAKEFWQAYCSPHAMWSWLVSNS